MTDLLIRRAGVEDARTIAEVHVAAWRETYAALVPAEALSALDIEEQTAGWIDSFRARAENPDYAVFVVSRAGEAVEGFGFCGPPRSERLAQAGYDGEFHAIYLLRSLQRRGGGRALMRAMAEHLLARDRTSAGVWVFRDNPGARRFYQALGAETTGLEGDLTWLGVTLPDLAYGWRDISRLAAMATE